MEEKSVVFKNKQAEEEGGRHTQKKKIFGGKLRAMGTASQKKFDKWLRAVSTASQKKNINGKRLPRLIQDL